MKKIYTLSSLVFLFVITTSLCHAQKTELYGESFLNGANNGAGTIFKVDSTGAVTDLHDFSSTNVIFNYDISTGTETDLYDGFSGSIVKAPGCKLIEYIVPDSTTGISQVAVNDEQIKIYPNPMGDAGTFAFNANTVKEIKLFNIFGQQVRDYNSIAGSIVQLQREELTLGIYFYSAIMTNGGIVNGKIVIQ